MRAIHRFRARGFTLVELMIVVAIIGILAALAIFGTRRYLASAKSAEARNSLGAINRAAVAAYERESTKSEILPGQTQSTTGNHALCLSSQPVPAGGKPLPARKYQPLTGPTQDFNAGTSTAGWRCLRFTMSQAHYYAYAYSSSGAGVNATAQIAKVLTPPAGAHWLAEAAGDLNGDGANFSNFIGSGAIDNGFPKISTILLEANFDE